MNNKYLSFCMTSLLLGGSMAVAAKQKAESANKKNVLFLIMDDLRPELNCYGAHYMKTPSIDRLARQGVMFENAYCNVPVSGASRASMFSGLRPAITRFWDVNALIDVETEGTVTLPQHFRENGYTTISNSKVIHGENDARERSWDEVWKPKLKSSTWRDYLGDENLSVERLKGGPAAYECLDVADNEYSDGKTADKAIADLKKLSTSNKPFFLAVGILKPHLPFNAPKRYWDLYDESKISLPETFNFDRTGFPDKAFHNYNEIRYYRDIPAKSDIPAEEAIKLIHGYRACVSYADAQVGRILDELTRLGLDKNTIVVLVGDHGWSLGDHNQWCKHSNFNIVNKAPLIIRVPGNTKHGPESKVVEFVDLYPTLCDLAGLSTPSHVEGLSMKKLLMGKDDSWKDCAIVKWHGGLTYLDRNYGYTEWCDNQGNVTDQMLFTYRNDPLETVNLADDPAYASTVERLRKEIKDRRGANFLVKTPRVGREVKNKKRAGGQRSKNGNAKRNNSNKQTQKVNNEQ